MLMYAAIEDGQPTRSGVAAATNGVNRAPLAVFLRGYAIAATGVPPRHPDEDTTESHETVPYAITSV